MPEAPQLHFDMSLLYAKPPACTVWTKPNALLDQSLSQPDRRHRILCIAVSTNQLSPFAADRGSSDHDLDPIAQVGLFKCLITLRCMVMVVVSKADSPSGSAPFPPPSRQRSL